MFSHPRKVVDRWVGNDPINLHEGRIKNLSYTFKVVADEITPEQKETALNVLNNYEKYWSEIHKKIIQHHSLNNIGDRLLLYIPARVGKDKYEIMIGYEFLVEEMLYSTFFAYNKGQLSYVHVDSH